MVQASNSVTSIHGRAPVDRRRVFNRNFTPAITTELYIVIDRDGWVRERRPSDLTKAQTIRDILDCQFSVGAVLCVCPDERSGYDASNDMAREVLNAADRPLVGDALDFIEHELGVEAAREVA